MIQVEGTYLTPDKKEISTKSISPQQTSPILSVDSKKVKSEEKPSTDVQRCDSDADYSNEALRDIMNGNDCKIDDPDLIIVGSDKARVLAARTSPLALINVLIAKWKHAGHNIQTGGMWETKDKVSNKSVWNWKIGLIEKNIFGQAGDFNKQRARQ